MKAGLRQLRYGDAPDQPDREAENSAAINQMRLRRAIFLPVDFQNFSSSGLQSESLPVRLLSACSFAVTIGAPLCRGQPNTLGRIKPRQHVDRFVDCAPDAAPDRTPVSQRSSECRASRTSWKVE